MQPDTLVRWQSGNITLEGRIVHNGGNMATVRSHGDTYELPVAQLEVVKVCLQCGKSMKGKRRRAKYCSRECVNLAYLLTERKCAICGGPRQKNRKYCSPKCRKIARAASSNRCVECGGICGSRHNQYCSHTCESVAWFREADQIVFAGIVEYKRAHQGGTPKIDVLAAQVFFSVCATGDALKRLAKAGKICFEGSGSYRQILVPNARWVYEEPAT